MTTTNDAPAPAPSGSGVLEARQTLEDIYVGKTLLDHAAYERILSALSLSETSCCKGLAPLNECKCEKDRASLASDASPRGGRVEQLERELATEKARADRNFKIGKMAQDMLSALHAHPAPATVEDAARTVYSAFKDAADLPRPVFDAAGKGHFFTALRLLFDPGAALSAPATPAPSAETGASVGVKKLEWHELSDCCIAHTPFGIYKVAMAGETANMFIAGATMPKSFHASLDAAKAAAQQDYASRIRSALASEGRSDG